MKIYPNVPIKYERFPDNYINDVNGWAFDKKTIESNKGKLLTLDIDYGSYCSLNCPTCFRKSNTIDDIKHELKFDDLVDVIHQAKELGLRTVKFLGAGDPFENSGFLRFLKFLKNENIIPLIFTKGQVIGDNSLVKKYFESDGIYTGEQLVKELDMCNTSILLSINSFDDEIQGKLVGQSRNFIHIRNRALELLAQAGFNDSNPTRLAIINSPLTIWNYDEAFEIYKWGRKRNLYTVTTPTMVSGRTKGEAWKTINPSNKQLIDLYTELYKFNIDTNLQTKEQILEEGISSYAGAHPCNQVSTGMYVSLNGVVLSCSGSEDSIEGNYWERSIKDIWIESKNFNRSGIFNNGCIAKEGKSIPNGFYDKILNNIINYEQN